MSVKHTPGPWHVSETGNEIRICSRIIPTFEVVGPDMCWIAQVQDHRSCINTPEGDANARLMAAAPDLLEALKELLPEGWDDGVMDHMPGVKKSRLAIAKAEGRV